MILSSGIEEKAVELSQAGTPTDVADIHFWYKKNISISGKTSVESLWLNCVTTTLRKRLNKQIKGERSYVII